MSAVGCKLITADIGYTYGGTNKKERNPMEKGKINKQGLITAGIIVGIVLILGFGIFGAIMGVKNKGIRYEENISENLSNINKEKTRKYSVFTNMVDAIESYNKYEGETLEKIIAARTDPNKTDEGMHLISALAEQYPELKSNENYKTYLTEVSVTENRISNYIEVYNKELKEYNAWSRSFPVSMFYTQQNFNYFEDAKAEIDIDGKLFSK